MVLNKYAGFLMLLSLILLGAASARASNFVAEDPGLERRLSQTERQALFKPPRPLPKEDIPYYWPYQDVPPPKLAEAHPDAKPQKDWTPRQYFNHLCKLEAGDFIYKPVRAEGYYVIRPYFMLNNGPDLLMRDRDAVEDPVIANYPDKFDYRSFAKAAAPEDLAAGRGYAFVEFPWLDARDIPHYNLYYEIDMYRDGWEYYPKHIVEVWGEHNTRGLMVVRKGEQGHFVRFTNLPEKQELEITFPDGAKLKKWEYPRLEERTDMLKSRYGIFWRGITRPHDREMGIGGGEVYVVDLRTNEVLGMQRHFMMGAPVPSGRLNGQDANFFWRTMLGCPSSGERTSLIHIVHQFIRTVLVPLNAPSK